MMGISTLRRLLCVFALLSTPLVAVPQAKGEELNQALQQLPNVQGKFYIASESYAPNAQRAVILVAEPHWNPKAQAQLRQFIQTISATPLGQQLQLLCVEGSSGEFSLESSRQDFRVHRDRYIYCMAKGLLSGWEIYALENNAVRVVGVEDPGVFQEQINTFTPNYGTFYQNIAGPALAAHDYRLTQFQNLVARGATQPSPDFNHDEILAMSFLLDQMALEFTDPLPSLEDFRRRYQSAAEHLPKLSKRVIRLVTDSMVDGLVLRRAAQARDWDTYYASIASVWKNDPNAAKIRVAERIEEDRALMRVAAKRDGVMANKCADALARGPARLCFLFIGDAHADGIAAELRRLGISSVFYQQIKPGNPDYNLYYARLKNNHPLSVLNSVMRTLPPSFLNPIGDPSMKSDLVAAITRMDDAKVSAGLKNFDADSGAIVHTSDILSKVHGHLESGKKIATLDLTEVKFRQALSGGASGDEVSNLVVKQPGCDLDIVAKVFHDPEKGAQDLANVQAINAAAEANGMPKLYASYFGGKQTRVDNDTRFLTLQEMVGGYTLKSVLNDPSRNLSAAQKREYLDTFAKRARDLDAVTSALLTEGKIHYQKEITTYRELYSKLKAKVDHSVELNNSLYKEDANKKEFDAYYKELVDLYGKFFDREGTLPELGIYHDLNLGNYFVDGTFIDSADDVICSRMKTKALLLKEIAMQELNFAAKDPSDLENVMKIQDILHRVIGNAPSDDQFAQIIGFLYLFDLSDSRLAKKDFKFELESATAFINYLKPGISDSDRCAEFHEISVAARERQKKNLLILLMLKSYNAEHGKKLEEQIKRFEERYKSGLYVMTNEPCCDSEQPAES